ncbi:MAG: SDR family NAD(P)-dependent oxidoreductase [Pseudomonadota bacterium]|nr:SDR family NAD(P)-dependent oxidoreductase [Pseudomonadota bacterium]
MNMQGKLVVITGAARGLGSATAGLLKASGAIVIGLDLDSAEAPAHFDAFHCIDLCDHATVTETARRIARDYGDVDVLVNNAAILTLDSGALGISSSVRQSFDCNLFAPWHLTSVMLPGLLRKRGRVINVSSLFALVNAPFVAAYAASKRALFAYSDALRMEHRGALAVVTVFPGFIDTAIHRGTDPVGLSVQRLVSFKFGNTTVLSLEEKLAAAARGLAATCAGSGGRNRGLTVLGTLTMITARCLPGVVDGFISWRIASLVRAGKLHLKPELIQ